MTDGTGTTTYTYDDMGDQTSQTFMALSGSGLSDQVVSHTYYSTGDLATTTYPSYGSTSDPTATYTYDSSGNMTSVSDWLNDTVSFGYDEDNNLQTQSDTTDTNTTPTTVSTTTNAYDAADQVTSVASQETGTCLTQSGTSGSMGRNPDGQLISEGFGSSSGSCGDSAAATSPSMYYDYDDAGRVVYQGTSAESSCGSGPCSDSDSANTFGYDAAGDLTTINQDSSGTPTQHNQCYDGAPGEVTSQTTGSL